MNKPTRSRKSLDQESVIAQIQDLIGSDLTQHTDTNLIELGLDSLHIMRLSNQWRSQGSRVTFAKLIEQPVLSRWLELLLPEQQQDTPQEESINALAERIRQDTHYSEAPFALTDVQYAYWIGRQDDQELGGVGCHAYLEIDGQAVEPKRLEQAWHALINQHSMLRARFNDNGQQYIPDTVSLPVLSVHDLRLLTQQQAKLRARAIRDTLSHRKLDIENGQVMGLALTQFANGRTRIHFDIDLLVADVQSLHILLRDLASAYNAIGNNLEQDPDRPLKDILKADAQWRFSHYLATEQARHQDSLAADKAYWQKRLVELPSGPQLPLACEPKSVTRPAFSRRSHQLSLEKWQNIKAIAAKFSLTPAMVLASAYGQVLARWSAEPEFVLNVPLFDRQTDHTGIEDVVADFTNLMLLECNYLTPQPFLAQTEQLQRQLHRDLAHARYSAVSIQRELARQGREQGVSAAVVFACNLGTPLLTEQCQHTLGTLHYMISQTPQVWLDHQLYEGEDGLLLAWDAVDALFPPQLIDNMFRAYTDLLEALADNEQNWHHTNPIALPAEQLTQRRLANQTKQDIEPRLLHQEMFTIARQTPHRIALIDSQQQMSYGEVALRALQIARLLQQHGLSAGEPVAVTLPKGCSQICAVMGILAAGGCYVPIGIHQPGARQTKIHRTAGIRLVLSNTEHHANVAAQTITCLDIGKADALEPLPEPITVSPTQSAYIIFTSGSSGEPKGVEMAHQATSNTIDDINVRYGVHADSRVLAVSALDFDLSVYDIFGVLSVGGAMVLIGEEQRRDATAWLSLIEQHKITVWNTVPVLLDMLMVIAQDHPRREEHPVLPFEQVMLSGDWIGLDMPPRLHVLTSPTVKLVAMGGATEAAIWSNTFDQFIPGKTLPASWSSIPYGAPLANQCYRVVDVQGQDCPDWVPGELWIGGRGLAEGYRGDETLTEQRFVFAKTDTLDNVQDELRWYRTGDLGRYWPNGHLEFLGRLDHQVKIRGHRIELGEIETALLNQPVINRAVVVTLLSDDQPATLAAAVVAEPGHHIDTKTVTTGLLQLVPDYMVPSLLVEVEAIPINNNGKVDRKQIIALLFEHLNNQRETLTPLQTTNEIAVAKVWQRLLSAEQLGRESNFYTLGGDSLLATQVISTLRQQGFDAEHPLRHLFANPTLAEFAAIWHEGETVEPMQHIEPDLANRHQPFPFTEVQQAYWMGQSPGLPINCGTHYLVELDGENVDLDRLAQAWHALVERHEMLRAIITPDGMQQILPSVAPQPIKQSRIDASQHTDGLTAARQQLKQYWQELSEHQQNQAVSLTTDVSPAHRLFAVHYHDPQGKPRQRIGIIFDYLTLDGFSIKLLLEQLATAYSTPNQLPPVPDLSFRDYVNQLIPDSDELARAEKYWTGKLQSLPMAASLPLALEPDTLNDMTVRRRHARLDRSKWQLLKDKARSHQITPSVLLLVAYSQIIRTWNSDRDHTLNLTLFDRKDVHPDINQVVGDFTSLAPIGFYQERGHSLLEQARATQQEIAHALEHKAISSIWIQRERAREMSMTAAALPIVFTSTLGLGNGLFEQAPAGFLEFAAGGLSETPQVWLDHQLYEYNGELTLSWDTVEGLFPKGMIDDMFDAYLNLLDQLVTLDWQQPLTLPLPQAQLAARRDANHTQQTIPPRLLHQPMFDIARTTPERIALIAGKQTISYGKLATQALQIAALLQQHGLKNNEPLAITLPKGPAQIAAVFGVLAAGGCYVPIGIHQPEARQSRIYRTAGIRMVLSDHNHHSCVAAEGITYLDIYHSNNLAPLSEPVAVSPEQSAYIIFTSGSTGEPKGVEMTHQATANTIDDVNTRYGVHADSRTLAVSALDFDLSVYDIFGLLSCGGTIVLIDEHQRRDAGIWLALIQRHQVTVWNTVPVLFDMLLVEAQSKATEDHTLKLPFEQVLLSGDWIGLDIPDRLFTLNVPDVKLAAMGGATEAAIWSNTFDQFSPEHGLPTHWISIPYGKPLANQYYRVVDSQGQDCPDWVPGELWIGGTGLAKGYRGDPVLSAQRFVQADSNTQPGITGEQRWYRTGDLGRYWPDGNLEFLGRQDHQVKVRGHRIELGEVETALRSQPAVSRAVAVTLRPAGQPSALAAAVVAKQNLCFDEQVIKTGLQQLVPDYMIPTLLIEVDDIPLSHNGKIDRKQITAMLTEYLAKQSTVLTPVQTTTEQTVATIWQQLLKTENIGRESHFFTLGGDSLLATQAIAALRQAGLDAEQPLRLLFAKPVLAEFAAELSQSDISEALPALIAEPDNRCEPFPLTEVQQAYWMGQSPGLPLNCGTHYLVELDGDMVDVARLEQAWNGLVERHDMLRVVVDEHGQSQTIQPQVTPYRIEIAPQCYVSQTEAKAQISQWWQSVTQAAEQTLFAIRIVRYGNQRNRLGLMFNYQTLDGFSIKLLLKELAIRYQDPQALLPEFDISFRDYVNQIQPQPAALERAQAYWQKKLSTLPLAPALPLAKDPRTLNKPQFCRREAKLNAQLWLQLRQSAQQQGITPSALILAAYAEVLSQWSSGAALTVNLTLFDRKPVHADINKIVGDFTSLAPVSYTPDRSMTQLDVARQLQQEVADALEHRELSSIWVQRERAKTMDMTAAALPVVFTSTLGISDDLLGDDTMVHFPQLVGGGLSETPQVWLDHQMYESQGELLISWDSVDELFPAGMLDDMFCQFIKVVSQMTTQWQSPFAPLLPDAQKQVRQKVNAPNSEALSPRLLHNDMFDIARRHPQRIALIANDKQLTYGELANQALRIASALRCDGLQDGEPVGITLPKGCNQICAVFGILAAGGCYVPIGIHQPAARQAKIHQRAGIRRVLTDAGHSHLIPTNEVCAISIDTVLLAEPLAEPIPICPEQSAYIIFTSGSTGEPKGVEIAHQATANTIDDINTRYGVHADSRVLAISALDFDLSVYDIFGLLSTGGAMVLIGEEQRRDATAWLKLVECHNITVWNTVPVLLDMLMVVAEHPTRSSQHPALPFEQVMLSGDWIGLDLPGRLFALSGPEIRLAAMGGATEAAIWSNTFDQFQLGHLLPANCHSIPYGYPLNNQCYRVVDAHGRDCPDWVAGELWIGGAGVARGYCGDQALTKASFIMASTETCGDDTTPLRWYRTGDLGRYWPDGSLEFLGRLDHQVKIRGHRIELGEIETALMTLPSVIKAVAVALRPANQPTTLAAAMVMAEGMMVDTSAIQSELHQLLPDYMVPSSLVAVADIPLSSNGKVDRKQITQMLVEHAPQAGFESPADELEQDIASIWREVLRLERISRHDDFFAIGGDSLSATQIVQQLQQQRVSPDSISLVTLFTAPNIAELGQQIRAQWLALSSEHTQTSESTFEEGSI